MADPSICIDVGPRHHSMIACPCLPVRLCYVPGIRGTGHREWWAWRIDV